jgi:Cu/Ag efflux protein CusF
MAEMVGEDRLLHLGQGGSGGAHLGQHVDAIAVALDHGGNAAHLPLDPGEALGDIGFGFGTHGQVDTPWGYPSATAFYQSRKDAAAFQPPLCGKAVTCPRERRPAMSKPLPTLILIGLLAASPALAQLGGGGGGGVGGGQGGGGHGGGRGGKGGGGKAPASKPAEGRAPGIEADKPTNQIEIVGVITAIDPVTSRVTIAYEPVDELNWPKGTMPFPVAKDELLKDRKVGEKVRFKVEDHEIYEITPFDETSKT